MSFVGNFNAYNELIGWLNKRDFPKSLSRASVLLLVGSAGVGKTHGVHQACKELQLNLQVIDTNLVSSFKEFLDVFQKMCASDITAQFRCIKRESIVFLIDELEAFQALDRTFLSGLQRVFDAGGLPHARIIITTATMDARKEDGYQRILLRAPAEGDVLLFLREQAPDMPLKHCLSIAEVCNGNLSFALQMLQMKMANEAKASPSQGMDCEGVVSDILVHANPQVAYRVFSDDIWINPLRFHTNLPHEWRQRKGGAAVKRRAYFDMMRNMCHWDVLMGHCKGEDVNVPVTFMAYAAAQLGNLERKKNAAPPTEDFTRVFSQLSLEKKNLVAMENASYLTDGLHSYHRHLHDSLVNGKKAKKKHFLRDK